MSKLRHHLVQSGQLVDQDINFLLETTTVPRHAQGEGETSPSLKKMRIKSAHTAFRKQQLKQISEMDTY